jgi:hypothetical protein
VDEVLGETCAVEEGEGTRRAHFGVRTRFLDDAPGALASTFLSSASSQAETPAIATRLDVIHALIGLPAQSHYAPAHLVSPRKVREIDDQMIVAQMAFESVDNPFVAQPDHDDFRGGSLFDGRENLGNERLGVFGQLVGFEEEVGLIGDVERGQDCETEAPPNGGRAGLMRCWAMR